MTGVGGANVAIGGGSPYLLYITLTTSRGPQLFVRGVRPPGPEPGYEYLVEYRAKPSAYWDHY